VRNGNVILRYCNALHYIKSNVVQLVDLVMRAKSMHAQSIMLSCGRLAVEQCEGRLNAV
jgi:hypothetical protein